MKIYYIEKILFSSFLVSFSFLFENLIRAKRLLLLLVIYEI